MYAASSLCQAISKACRLPTIIIPGILQSVLNVGDLIIGEGESGQSSVQPARKCTFRLSVV